MSNYDTGVRNRGPSNSVASPGISVLFGGMPKYHETLHNVEKVIPPQYIPPSHSYLHTTPAYIPKSEGIPNIRPQTHHSTSYNRTSDVPQPQNGHQNRAQENNRPQTQSHSESKNHQESQFQVQSRPQQKAAPERHYDPKPEHHSTSDSQSNSHHNTAHIQSHQVHEPVTKESTLYPQKHPSSRHNHTTFHLTQQPKLTFQSLQDTYKQRLSANEEVPPTEMQARMLYRQEQPYPDPSEIADSIKTNIDKSKAELRTTLHQQRNQVDRDLAAQVGQSNMMKQLFKAAQKEAHKQSTGFEYEAYQYGEKMNANNQSTKSFNKQQLKQDLVRRNNDTEERRKKPDSMPTVEEYMKMTNASKQELYHTKKNMEDDLRDTYSRTINQAKNLKETALQQQRRVENEKIQQTKKMIEYENMKHSTKKQQNNQDMMSTLDTIDKRKKQEWNTKVQDKSNKTQTEQFNREKQRLKQDLANERVKHKSEYKNDLMTHQHQNKERNSRLAQDNAVTDRGFDFE